MCEQKSINPIEDRGVTSADIIAVVECLKDYLGHEYGGRGKPLEVLQALTEMTLQRLRQSKDAKLTAFNLHYQVEGNNADEGTSARWLSPIWKKLEENMSEREQGLQQYAAQKGLGFYPCLEKTKSQGGAGNTSYYFLQIKRINNEVVDESRQDSLEPNQLRYIRELTPQPAWWAKKLLDGGYVLQGWRRWLLILYFVGVTLIVGSFLFILWLMIGYSKALAPVELFKILSTAVIALWLGWSALSPYIKVLDWRITMAPDVLTSFKETNVQLELFREEDGRSGIIRLVRYAGSCPICNGKVLLADGKKVFPNRLIGRCEESPAEHVYSFDRKTLAGKLLS